MHNFLWRNALRVGLQAYSVSSENHTVKIGRGGSDVDLEHHTYEPTYEPLGSADFDTLLDEIAEVVHTQYWKADEAECWEADEARCWEADEAQCWEADEERSCEADEAQCWEADEAATDEMLMMFDSPARLQGPCIRQAAGTHCVRGTELQEQTSRYSGVCWLETPDETGNFSPLCIAASCVDSH